MIPEDRELLAELTRLNLVQSAGIAGGDHENNRPYPLVISADTADRVLCDYFLANAGRGDNAANDEFVAELALRIRAGQARSVGGSFPRALETTAVPHRGLR
jgi:hypothetical protein